MRLLEKAADRAPFALVWLAAAGIGFLVYFLPLARLLDRFIE
jgi:hypothetical protein